MSKLTATKRKVSVLGVPQIVNEGGLDQSFSSDMQQSDTEDNLSQLEIVSKSENDQSAGGSSSGFSSSTGHA